MTALVAFAAALVGASLFVTAVWLLAGLGWALLASSVPFLVFAAVLLRGLHAT